MSEKSKKFAILSHSLPPDLSGQAIVLGRLLDRLPSEDFCLISSGQGRGDMTSSLSPQRWQLDKPRKGWERMAKRSGPFATKVASWQVDKRARQIERILRDNDIRLVVACSGDILDIPAGAAAAKRVGAAFFPYFFDDYCYQWTGWQRGVARKLEQISLNGASGVFVPNEFLAEEYRRRYGIACQVVRNPILPQSVTSEVPRGSVVGTRKKIVYTGSVYHAHFDAFSNLVKMLDQEGIADFHIYTTQSAEVLARNGICGPYVHLHGHVSQEESVQVQQEADILFLPLAFSSSIPEVLRTSAPGKMGEYLVSGRPILVHAPADSFLSWFFHKHQCGAVVDTPDHNELAVVVRQLLTNDEKVFCMVSQARRVAVTEFDAGRQSEIFFSFINNAIQEII